VGRAQRAGRFLVTQDLDFSDVRRFEPGSHHGLLLVRLPDAEQWRGLRRGVVDGACGKHRGTVLRGGIAESDPGASAGQQCSNGVCI
jgi:hypothetical protein